jgi:serine/threonine protein phosphatase PrpC
MQIGGWSRVGPLRARNEDAIGWDERSGIAVLADGLGGHPAGDVASRLTVQAVLARARRGEGVWLEAGDAPQDLITRAHRALALHARRRPQTRGMGSTLVVACVGPEHVAIAHVGDSRAYRLHGGRLALLTHDHTLAQEAVDQQWLTADEARTSPHRHRLTQAIGLDDAPEPDLQEYPRSAGDIYLLCSDGVSAELDEATLERLLVDSTDLEHSARAIVDAAQRAGSPDDASAVLLRV